MEKIWERTDLNGYQEDRLSVWLNDGRLTFQSDNGDRVTISLTNEQTEDLLETLKKVDSMSL